ncbi:hypothetical protein H0H81_000195 [Sphagnurus paluster]|uniref:Uncharacterized protein n=1 Tax=Sphagnurus paluster TaxID=117069 RepID=A0A9P7GNJ9_9AGAR|nr:hypothetical protein H0H81_000195 [Sphagnurus paluster]
MTNATDRAAQISFEIREALRKALPAPKEQFFTVMVPGKVINFDDYTQGYDLEGKPTGIVLPTVTELNQAILCDDMPAFAPVQLGPTGKSVAHSYDAAISKLVAAGTTVGVDITEGKELTPDEARYSKAMKWLTAQDPDKGNLTRVERYTEKQRAYTKAVEAKAKAFGDALERVQSDPRYVGQHQQRAAFDKWVDENARTYRNFMQAAYMDWVVNGMKEEVEYWFSVVDRDSSMSRVEASKEAMRASVVQDVDGSVGYHKVKLTPANWAVIAKKKATGGEKKMRTVEWYDWEINRLEKTNGMLLALQKNPPLQSQNATPQKDDAGFNAAMSDYLKKREEYYRKESSKASDADKKAAYAEYTKAQENLQKAQAKRDQETIENSNSANQAAQDKLYRSFSGDNGLSAQIIKENNTKIDQYKVEREKLVGGTNGDAVVAQLAADAKIPAPKADPQADTTTVPTKSEEDYWTTISLEISSASSSEKSSSKATKASLGASVRYGLFSADVSVDHSSSSADAEAEMANNSVKISFECMRVDIARNWLRGELFYDADLTVGPNE